MTKKEIGESLSIIYEETKRAKNAKWLKERNKELKWLLGDQIIKDRPSYKANTVTNFLFSQFNTVQSILAKRTPSLALSPVFDNEDWQYYAKKITEKQNLVLGANDFSKVFNKFVVNLLAFGFAMWKCVWDPRMRGGRGDIRILAPDPRSIYLEENCDNPATANYMFEATEVNRLSLYRKYPKFKDKIDALFEGRREEEAFDTEIHKSPDAHGHLVAEAGEAENTTSVSYIWDMAAKKGEQVKDSIDLVECWVFDEETFDDIEEMEERDDKTGEKKIVKKEVKRMRYPTGRLVTLVGKEVFGDRPNPFPDFPYVMCKLYDFPNSQYGMSWLQQIKAIQELYNIRNNQITDFINYNTHPKYLAGVKSGLEEDNWTNRPGELTMCTDPRDVVRLDPPQINAAMFESLFGIKKSLEEVGIPEVSYGDVPGDIRSGAGVDSLREAAFSKLEPFSLAIEDSVRQLSQMMVRMMNKYYEKGVHYYETDLDLKSDVVQPYHFEYDVKAGTNLPSSRVAQQQFIQWLFVNEIVDEDYVVEHSNLDGTEELLKRMRPKWEEKERIAMQMAQQGKGGIEGA